jgi:hypothetical protein
VQIRKFRAIASVLLACFALLYICPCGAQSTSAQPSLTASASSPTSLTATAGKWVPYVRKWPVQTAPDDAPLVAGVLSQSIVALFDADNHLNVYFWQDKKGSRKAPFAILSGGRDPRNPVFDVEGLFALGSYQLDAQRYFDKPVLDRYVDGEDILRVFRPRKKGKEFGFSIFNGADNRSDAILEMYFERKGSRKCPKEYLSSGMAPGDQCNLYYGEAVLYQYSRSPTFKLLRHTNLGKVWVQVDLGKDDRNDPLYQPWALLDLLEGLLFSPHAESKNRK